MVRIGRGSARAGCGWPVHCSDHCGRAGCGDRARGDRQGRVDRRRGVASRRRGALVLHAATARPPRALHPAGVAGGGHSRRPRPDPRGCPGRCRLRPDRPAVQPVARRQDPHRLRQPEQPERRPARLWAGPQRGPGRHGERRRRQGVRLRRRHLRLLHEPSRPRLHRRRRDCRSFRRSAIARRARRSIVRTRTLSGTASRWSTARATPLRTTSSATS